MEKIEILKPYNLLLIRYGEIWLKSQKIKVRMLKRLIENIKILLKINEITYHKYQISKDSSRIFFFFKNEDLSTSIKIINNTFGVYSVSPALRTSNKIENIIERSIEISKSILTRGDSFAVRVKRSGKHDYTSLEVAKKVGEAILKDYKDLDLRVNLSSPKKKLYIEIRNDFSYIFTQIINSEWGGLPIEPNKIIIALDVGRTVDLLASFLLMRRGCSIYPILFDIMGEQETLENRINNWKQIMKYYPSFSYKLFIFDIKGILQEIWNSLDDKSLMCGMCRLIRFIIANESKLKINEFGKFRNVAFTDGLNVNSICPCNDSVDLDSIILNNRLFNNLILTPLIGLTKKQIIEIMLKISPEIKELNYCPFKPKKQYFEIEKILNLMNVLKIRKHVNDIFNNLEILHIKNIKMS
ncbi:MAG: THUMP domain-containing protein [Promethearchaeota archaeon]